MVYRKAILAALSMILGALYAHGQSESEKFHELLEAEWAYAMEQFPEFATSTGWPGQNHRWTDWSIAAIDARREHTRLLPGRIQAINRDKLDARDLLSYDLFLYRATRSADGLPFRGDFMPINQMGGPHLNLAGTIARMRAVTAADYDDILARLEAVPVVLGQVTILMREGLERGLTPPRIVLRHIPVQIRNQIVDDPWQSPFLAPFKEFGPGTPESEHTRLKDAAERAYTDSIRPAFEAFLEFVEATYLPRTRESIAHTELPDGAAWYAYDVRMMTTTDMSPEAIHALGQSEVKRIRAEMEEVMTSARFEGGFDAFTEFLRTDSQFYFETPGELLAAYRDIAKRADPELVKLFGTLPRLPYGIRAVPAYREQAATTAYYEPGSPAAGRPGYFYANTYNLNARPKWEMEALTLHEAVPGHHLQIALAQELEDVPEFRKWGGYTAYVEGWGLYAEYLGEEMGFYTDPYAKYGQLSYEMWRAIRLVVDTGMHALGWSRDEAIAFFKENSGKPEHDIVVEIDRYIAWPGQALAYKIGELKIKELRQRAEQSLGERFDVRAFHDAVLAEGALPLNILEQHIEEWIEAQR